MTLHRSPLLPALAASVSVLLLAGCPNAGTAPPLPGDARFSASPSAAASMTPGASASAAVSAAPSAGTSPAPSASASATASVDPGASARPTPVQTVNPAPTGAVTILQGRVYDEEGATVEGATVTIRSLDTRSAYNATATTSGGNYVINNVPVGVQIELSVTKAGWTTRRRVTSLQDRVTNQNTLDFGSQLSGVNDDDATGAAYFISNYPEIASATPGASPIAGDKLTYKVRFSEPLDEDNRDLVVNGFEIAAPGVAGNLMPDAIVGTPRILIEESSSFLDEGRKTEFSWNAEGTELTFNFDAPLRASDSDDKSYTFSIRRQTGDEVIEDGEGKVLGYKEPGGGAQYNAIKRSTLSISSPTASSETRWNDTHNPSTSFDVKEDETDPKVTGIKTNKFTDGGTEYRRITVTFSEPMRVYPDASGYAQSLITLSNYVFAFSEDNDLNGVDMDDAPVDYNVTTGGATPSTSERFREGTANSLHEEPVRFVVAGGVRIQPSDSDPNSVQIDIPEVELPSQLKRVKVKVETNVIDPAGNRVSEKGENNSDNLADNIVEGSY